jgi:nitrate reductase delta subunit
VRTYKVAALLLRYPEADWIAELPALCAALDAERWFNHRAAERLAPLFDRLRGPLIEAQADYVETFDRRSAHGLYLFEHLHGESRARGTAMVELLERYRAHGLELDCNELPDHLPVFLEFLSLLPKRQARRELRAAASVLRVLGGRLEKAHSPYARVFDVLMRLAPRTAASGTPEAPRAMEQLLEREGRLPDGSEPLLTPEVLVPVSSLSRRPAPPGGNRS